MEEVLDKIANFGLEICAHGLVNRLTFSTREAVTKALDQYEGALHDYQEFGNSKENRSVRLKSDLGEEIVIALSKTATAMIVDFALAIKLNAEWKKDAELVTPGVEK